MGRAQSEVGWRRRLGGRCLLGLALALLSLGAYRGVRASQAVLAAGQAAAGQAVAEQRADQAVAEQAASQPLHRPDAVCAQCHAAIYASYEHTAMARGSGAAAEGLNDGLMAGQFHHEPSGVSYRIFARDGRVWMRFSRAAGGAGAADGAGAANRAGALEGERELLYFVGSGTRGRTFLYQQGGEWFELPVNYYGRRRQWAMAPAFDGVAAMPAPLPVDANCLHCHASEVETALPEAKNRFPQRPFDGAGMGCSTCHGDPAQHLAANGHGPILNPDKLPVAARDSACIQCHLEGDAVVYRPGRTLAQFQPGDTLSDFAVYFVRASQAAGGRRASSQYEALLQSACKRASGDALTCTTCHDPHRDPAPAERVAFYRARCLSCHSSPTIATQHHPEQPDCALCHMPTRATADISHEQLTDHNIQRRPAKHEASASPVAGEELVPVGGVAAGDRELGLAYAQLAQKGDRAAGERALQLLGRAEQAGVADVQVHLYLGVLEQLAGTAAAARSEYAAVLRTDPYNATALTNRAVLDAGRGDVGEAVRLLDRLITADPSQTQAGLDLAFLECSLGRVEESRALVGQLGALNPDDARVRAFLVSGRLGGKVCRTEGAR